MTGNSRVEVTLSPPPDGHIAVLRTAKGSLAGPDYGRGRNACLSGSPPRAAGGERDEHPRQPTDHRRAGGGRLCHPTPPDSPIADRGRPPGRS
ncbi:hypothetical protein ACIQGO_16830 [Streptomyces shenzhenensis]|uniref:hypothetical protein n=1 Tax=Streptomyces shenzhenensis TaxID=943815 RepID=UPI003820588F